MSEVAGRTSVNAYHAVSPSGTPQLGTERLIAVFEWRRNEKGGVVRRPFSKLQAWLIAVSPNRESLSLSAPRGS